MGNKDFTLRQGQALTPSIAYTLAIGTWAVRATAAPLRRRAAAVGGPPYSCPRVTTLLGRARWIKWYNGSATKSLLCCGQLALF